MTARDMTAVTSASAAARAETDVVLRMDEETFRGFYDRTARMLWAYLRHLTGSADAADDLLQESYYRFLRADATLATEALRKSYLFRIATNLAHDRFRRERRLPELVSDEREQAAGENTSRPDTRLHLAEAFSGLTPRERSLLWLAYAEGSSHQEIAARTGLRTGSIKSLLYRARRRLAARLGRGEGRP